MMHFNQGLHNHTTFSDGKNSIEAMVAAAAELGFDTVGISDHSYTSFDESYCMADDALPSYIAECKRIKEKYADRINVLCGLEVDYYSLVDRSLFDYTIGSVHYIKKCGEYISIDESPEILKSACDKHYNSDIYLMCEDYYNLVGSLSDCEIIGHLDLITKFSEVMPELINTRNPRYITARSKAILRLIDKGKIFEVNTGAMARGYKSVPYPSEDALKFVSESGGKITLTSDCHGKGKLNFGYRESMSLIGRCGFKSIYLYRDGKFREEPI